MKIIYEESKKQEVIYCERIYINPKIIALYREDALIKSIPILKVFSISDDEQFSVIR